jgi:hypothetical protein
MESLLNNFFSHPFFYVGALVSAFAAISFLLYLRGFIAGVGHVFDDGAHIGHQHHANERVVHGVLLLGITFIVWEIVRSIAGLF